MLLNKLESAFLQYVIDSQVAAGDPLPPLNEISNDLGISVGKLREQLEVARSLGLISIRPRVGMHREEYSFSPAVLKSVLFGLGTGEAEFAQYAALRRSVELSFWHDAVIRLTAEDLNVLKEIVGQAWAKLRGNPVHVPNDEHRQLHLTIFSRLQNPFVTGLLAAYWDAYEASEWTRYARYEYWLDVWDFHERIVNALRGGEYETGRQLLAEHFNLLPMTTSIVVT